MPTKRDLVSVKCNGNTKSRIDECFFQHTVRILKFQLTSTSSESIFKILQLLCKYNY